MNVVFLSYGQFLYVQLAFCVICHGCCKVISLEMSKYLQQFAQSHIITMW